MIQEIYTLDEIACQMGKTPKEVKKLADKDKLPGFIQQGQLCFTADSLMLYLENGLKEEKEAEKVRLHSFVEHSPLSQELEQFSILEYLTPDRILVPFEAKTTSAVFRDLVGFGVQSGLIWDSDKMIDELKKREEISSTAMENGVALLHPSRPQPSIIPESFLILGIASRGVPFGGGYDNLTDIFFLICSYEREIHLKIMRAIALLIQDEVFLAALRDCQSSQEVYDLIAVREIEI